MNIMAKFGFVEKAVSYVWLCLLKCIHTKKVVITVNNTKRYYFVKIASFAAYTVKKPLQSIF